MIVGVPSRIRPLRRYDHRMRDLVRRTGDVTAATDLGVPHPTARGWRAERATVVVSLDAANLTELELREEKPGSPTTARRSCQAADSDGCRSGLARASRYGRCCGSFGSRRAGSTPGVYALDDHSSLSAYITNC
jgi:hypothetical protein